MLLLYVDDDPDDIELLCEGINVIDPTCTCMSARNGVEALKVLRKVVPDVIFLDINMPVMDGRETLIKIRQQESLRHIPVYMFSTTADRDEIRKYKSIGAQGFFTKPSTFDKLCYLLRQLLGESSQ